MTDALTRAATELQRLRRETERQRVRAHERTVWLTTAATSTDWDGDAKNIGAYDLDLSAWGVPANVRAVHVRLIASWATANNGYEVRLRPAGGAGDVSVGVRAQVAGIAAENSGWVTCNAAGDIRASVVGANAASVYLAITGYML
jgi:hypothetical protein